MLVAQSRAGRKPSPHPPPTLPTVLQGDSGFGLRFQEDGGQLSLLPGVWTPARREQPGIRDALRTAEARVPWVALLRAQCGLGSGLQASTWLCLEMATGGTLDLAVLQGRSHCSRTSLCVPPRVLRPTGVAITLTLMTSTYTMQCLRGASHSSELCVSQDLLVIHQNTQVGAAINPLL